MFLLPPEKDKCEVNNCGKKADFTLCLNRLGIISKVHICKDCLKKLYLCLSDSLVPKSIETLKRKYNG